VVLSAAVLPLLLAGCPAFKPSGEVPITAKQADKYLRRDFYSVRTHWNGMVIPNRIPQVKQGPGRSLDLVEIFTGHVQLTPPTGVKGLGAFAGFSSSNLKSTMNLTLAARSDDATESGYAIATFRTRSAGSVCIRLAGKATAEAQKFQGSFSVLGGTGLGARLRSSGKVRAVQRVPFSNSWEFVVATSPTLASPRPIPTVCANAGTATPPPGTKKITASLDGFAFAPAGITTLPSGTTIYPSNSTISGNVGCGTDNNLYMAVSYQGPNGAILYAAYATTSGAKGGPPPTTLKPGQNAVLLVAAPTNDTYQLAPADVAPPPGATGDTGLTGSITLTRNC
jgi:hypothetical protein